MTTEQQLDILWQAMANERIWIGRYGVCGQCLGVFEAHQSAGNMGGADNACIEGFEGTREEQIAQLAAWLVAQRLS